MKVWLGGVLILLAGCASVQNGTKMLPVMGFADSQAAKAAVPADTQAALPAPAAPAAEIQAATAGAASAVQAAPDSASPDLARDPWQL